MTSPTELETRLRASLSEHARHAPPGTAVADRILAELDAPVLRPRSGWRTWTFPLLAAAAIAAVALTLVGLGNVRHSAAPAATPGAQHDHSAPRPTPTASAPESSTRPTGAHAAALPLLQMGGVVGFRALDTTYFGTNVIWALGHGDCGQGGSCLTLMHTTDSGASWHSVPVPAVPATSIRFANSDTGFLFGRTVLERTTDGGAHWTAESGGADAIETLDDTVIKVSRQNPSCAASCRFDVGYAALDRSSWTPSTVAPIQGYSVQLLRATGVSYLLVRTSDPASAEPQGQLYRSSDGGVSWHRSAGCAGLYDAALAADGTLDLLCGDRILVDANTPSAHYVTQATGRSASVAAVDARTLIICADRLFRSTDGGASLDTVLDRPPVASLGAPGFQNNRVGRWLDDGGRTIWTTTDGGATWTGAAFSR